MTTTFPKIPQSMLKWDGAMLTCEDLIDKRKFVARLGFSYCGGKCFITLNSPLGLHSLAYHKFNFELSSDGSVLKYSTKVD